MRINLRATHLLFSLSLFGCPAEPPAENTFDPGSAILLQLSAPGVDVTVLAEQGRTEIEVQGLVEGVSIVGAPENEGQIFDIVVDPGATQGLALTLLVPTTIAELQAETASGDIFVRGITNALVLNSAGGLVDAQGAEAITIDSAAGNILASAASRLTATATTGNITIADVTDDTDVFSASGAIILSNISGEIIAESVDGPIDISDSILDGIEVTTDSGDVNVDVVESSIIQVFSNTGDVSCSATANGTLDILLIESGTINVEDLANVNIEINTAGDIFGDNIQSTSLSASADGAVDLSGLSLIDTPLIEINAGADITLGLPSDTNAEFVGIAPNGITFNGITFNGLLNGSSASGSLNDGSNETSFALESATTITLNGE
jgi:DUF4097 and DUF4098 domain-containing protein YvlB